VDYVHPNDIELDSIVDKYQAKGELQGPPAKRSKLDLNLTLEDEYMFLPNQEKCNIGKGLVTIG